MISSRPSLPRAPWRPPLFRVALLRTGIRLWKRGDAVWAPEADAAFEEGPGPRMIPFGPYLVAGTLLAMFFGQNIIDAYTGWLKYAAGAA